jgi:diguanylate cyclase (GGDEF)-like protein
VHLAHYDALTDLPNRVMFRDQLEHEIKNIAPGRQLAMLYLDIDEFKSVNDSLGHRIGDELLKSVAVSLRSCIKATDFVARLSGDVEQTYSRHRRNDANYPKLPKPRSVFTI